jgi:hypothetical protein
VVIPQNILFTNRLIVGNGGFGAGHDTQFGLELENGSSVEFRRIQQMSISRTFERQYDSDSQLVSGSSVEIKLKSGDIIKEDVVVSYYGSGYLEYPSATGVSGLFAGDWITLQYIGAGG